MKYKIYLSIYQSINIYLSISIYQYLSIIIYLSLSIYHYLSIIIYLSLSIYHYLSIYLSTYLSIDLPIYLSLSTICNSCCVVAEWTLASTNQLYVAMLWLPAEVGRSFRCGVASRQTERKTACSQADRMAGT